MKTSLIIPAYNCARTINLCLNSIINQTKLPDEILIVLSDSTDKTLDILKEYKLKLNFKIYEINLSTPARARNIGIQNSTGDIIIFIDSDCIMPDYYIEKIIDIYRNENISTAGFKIIGYKPEPIIEKYLSEYGLSLPDENIIFDKLNLFESFIHTASFTSRKSVFYHTGFFNEDLITGEDHDLCYRIINSGFNIYYFVKPFIYHKFQNNFKRFLKQTYSFSIIHAPLIKRYSPGKMLLILNKKKYYIRSSIPFYLNFDNTALRFLLLILLCMFSKWFLILLILWILKLYKSLYNRFANKYNLSFFKIIIILVLHLIYNFVSFVGDTIGIMKLNHNASTLTTEHFNPNQI